MDEIKGFTLRGRKYRAMVSLSRPEAVDVAVEAEERNESASEVIRERVRRAGRERRK